MRLKSVFSLKKWVELCINQETISERLSDKTYIKLRYFAKFGRFPRLKNPVTYNEKMQWLKIYDQNPVYSELVDKYVVREHIKRILGGEYLIPLVGGPWNTFDEIDFAQLPDQFVLKCTHDSGGLVICRNKEVFDKALARRKIEQSLARNYFWQGREWPYKNVVPRIIAEKYMEDDQSGTGLTDYKFFCFNGRPQLLYVSKGLEDHSTAKISFFDFEGNQLPFSRRDYVPFEGNIALPESFSEMIVIAEKLANSITSPFVRVDLYSIRGEIYFSEITFFPCGGMIPFNPPEWDAKLGEYLVLPER